jgi:hypothetical protein
VLCDQKRRPAVVAHDGAHKTDASAHRVGATVAAEPTEGKDVGVLATARRRLWQAPPTDASLAAPAPAHAPCPNSVVKSGLRGTEIAEAGLTGSARASEGFQCARVQLCVRVCVCACV